MSTSTESPFTSGGGGAIVMGGSAGSLEALMAIFERLPPELEVPIVVVVHTPKEPPSGLVPVLSTRSRMPVREPDDKDPLTAGTVFVAPPGYHLLIDRGPAFALSVDPPEKFSQPSIDVLFESAADVFGDRLIGVVLSGANDDGALGLAAICEAGGRALVQEPTEATSDEMPRAALAACPGAEALCCGEIAARLVSMIHQNVRRGT